jgi:hypothetical protein
MAGEFIRVVHQCHRPDASAQGIGSIWRCECGKEWTSYETYGAGYYAGWYWSNRPPIIFTSQPSNWQLFINRLKGKK